MLIDLHMATANVIDVVLAICRKTRVHALNTVIIFNVEEQATQAMISDVHISC